MSINRRRRVLVASGLAAALPLRAGAQAMPRVGWLMFRSSATRGRSAREETSPLYEAFRQGLRELGYREGQNLVIEQRSAQHDAARLPGLAAELVRRNVALIVALEPPAVEAARGATKTVPIVMRSTGDPVELGWVASLARPGGNITGVSSYSSELYGKRIQLLGETIPGLSRVAVLWDPETPGLAERYRKIEAAARETGIALQSVPIEKATDLGKALESAARSGAALWLRGPRLVTEGRRLVILAIKHRVPVIYDDRELTERGGLMSYGTNLEEVSRRAALYVHRILKGARPGDLPVEQPTRFEFVVNRKAARAIGLTFPQSILLRADRVID